MKETRGELISALLDGELSDVESGKTLAKLLDGDSDGLAQFGRYRLIGDVMRGDAPMLSAQVAEGVRRALRDEPTVLTRSGRGRKWIGPVAGLAVAASVAATAVVVAPQILSPQAETAPAVQLAAGEPVAGMAPDLVAGVGAGPNDAPAQAMRWSAVDAQLVDHINRLVIEHHEFGGHTGVNGPVPHIGFVSYDAN